MSQVKAIIGLGNPGPEYDDTRHNAGAWLAAAIARDSHTPLRAERKFLGHYAKVHIAGGDLHLLLPQTYMNRSGGAVAALCQYFKLAPDELLVAHDDLDIAPGTARYKQGGGHGGHNGLRDIISALGNDNTFHRLRIGIGHPGDARQVTNYVLGRPSKAERTAIDTVFGEIEATLADAIRGDWARAMNRLHSFKP